MSRGHILFDMEESGRTTTFFNAAKDRAGDTRLISNGDVCQCLVCKGVYPYQTTDHALSVHLVGKTSETKYVKHSVIKVNFLSFWFVY
jgi:hypothetical protein